MIICPQEFLALFQRLEHGDQLTRPRGILRASDAPFHL